MSIIAPAVCFPTVIEEQSIQKAKIGFELENYFVTITTILSQDINTSLLPRLASSNSRILASIDQSSNQSFIVSFKFETPAANAELLSYSSAATPISSSTPFLSFKLKFDKVAYSQSPPKTKKSTKLLSQTCQQLSSQVAVEQNLQETISKNMTFSSSQNSIYSISHYFCQDTHNDAVSVYVCADSMSFTSRAEYTFSFGDFSESTDETNTSDRLFYANHNNNNNNSTTITPMNIEIEGLSFTNSSTASAASSPNGIRMNSSPSTTTQQLQSQQLLQQSEGDDLSISTETMLMKQQCCLSPSGLRVDKKNVVKNFMKAFDNYFLNMRYDEVIMEQFNISASSLRRLRIIHERLEKKFKFNNRIIIEMIGSPNKAIFEFFLRTQATAWIQNSNIVDKQSHLIILKDYLRAIADPSAIPKISNLKIRNRTNSTD